MRIALSIPVSILLAACGNDPSPRTDAGIHVVDAKAVDAKPIDAAVDAPPDAPPDAAPMNIVTACMHACDAIATCIGQPPDQDCYDGCQTDLADCSAQQVATIDACSTQPCGDIENNMSPLLDCIVAVSCVEMAVTGSRK
jgi:hypothetical protein